VKTSFLYRTDRMELPHQLGEDARQGRIVLVLGAGASVGATDENGRGAPDAPKLARLISERFLGGKHSNKELAFVSDLAISESDLGTVQEFVADQVRRLRPAPFHLRVPTFRWRGIASTNYDTVIEDAYATVATRAQTIVPFLSDRDRVDEKLRLENSLPLLKLHGCVTRTIDPSLPLILTPDQYVTHRDGRARLFDMLQGWGHEFPLVFVGHGIQDSDLRKVLLELAKAGSLRPRYYLIRPGLSSEEVRFWEQRKVGAFDATFEAFLGALEAAVPSQFRRLPTTAASEHPIARRFSAAEQMSEAIRAFLAHDVEYVHASLESEEGKPSAFYRGFDLGWYPIDAELDVRRDMTDDLLNEVILRRDVDRPTSADFYLVRAEAGAGKSVFLRRLAWEAAKHADALVLYARESGQLAYSSLEELHRLTKQRIFLFVDNAADHATLLEEILARARGIALPVTIIVAERMNEWNMGCERIAPFVTTPYVLPYLSRAESEQLLALLEKHGSLGQLLHRTPEERLKDVEVRAGRQLLVALHEATSGRPFEEIIIDEYNEIRPKLAQDIYLSVCVLNRLNIPVRAGVISRIYDVPFTDFRERLFAPLEHVVQVTQGGASQDYLYSARHAGIATIIFERVLGSQADRFNQYVALLGAMNLAYATDRDAYRALLRGRQIVDLFGDHNAAIEIFRIAEKAAPKDPFFFHQRGLYEMHRPNGNLDEALRYFRRAHELNTRDSAVLHSMAELERKRAELASTPYERERLRKDATKIAVDLMLDERSRPTARNTLVQLAISRLQDAISARTPSEREIDLAVQEIEKHLERGLQENPSDTYLMTAEARYSGIISDHERAFRALENAFKVNKRNPFITTRLAKAYAAKGDRANAIATLEAALDANPGDMQIHYRLGMELKEDPGTPIDRLLYHFRRAFTRGDKNYDAQFWYARYAFESGETDSVEDARQTFARLRSAPLPMSYDERVRVRARAIDNVGRPKVLTGYVMRREATYGFVEADGAGARIFFHRAESPQETWDKLATGTRVVFQLGFSFNGTVAIGTEPIF
jgi:tetratricopeptide (TPR) repeat protein/cold shock CspA family protein